MENDKHNNSKTIIIPEDIVEDIFQHLLTTSLARFKVLSKNWRSIIKSTYFSHKQLIRTGLSTPNVKFLYVTQHFSANFVEEDSNSITFLLETFSRDDHNNGKNCPSSILGSCDGLVLLRIHEDFKYIYLINPTTKEHMKLSPEFTQWPFTLSCFTPAVADKPWRQLSQSVLHYHLSGGLLKRMPFLAGFGKDIVTKSYKVILIYSRNKNYDHYFKAKVLSLDNGEQRDTSFYNLHHCIFCDEQTSVYANGSLFWLTLKKLKQTSYQVLAIDLHTEEFRWIVLPECDTKYATSIEMWNLNERLCLSDVLECSNLVVWSLHQKYPTEKWEKIYSINIEVIITNKLNKKFWMFGLAAAYFSSIRNHQDQVSFFRQRTISYSPTMISPSSLML
ncbi:putative F-box protein [Arabidopsis thaliana]